MKDRMERVRRQRLQLSQKTLIQSWGTGRRRFIPLDRLWHVKDVTKEGLAGANGSRLRQPFKVWEGDHPNCTTEVKATLLVAPSTRTVIGCAAEARWGTDIGGFVAKLSQLFGSDRLHVLAMPPLGTPAFMAFVVLFVAKRPRPVQAAYLKSLELTLWNAKDPAGIRSLPKGWVARFHRTG